MSNVTVQLPHKRTWNVSKSWSKIWPVLANVGAFGLVTAIVLFGKF
jgi:hypothetical protein